MAIKACFHIESRKFLGYNGSMPWIYLSPHFDDVAFSCGGLLWEQSQQGEEASIWTICAGDPPSTDLSPFARQLHQRWELSQNAPARRRMEDQTSTQRLGASSRYYSIPDCIYRRDPQTGDFMYASEAALNGALQPGDLQVIQRLLEEIRQAQVSPSVFISPLGLGNHVDHQLTRQAAEGLECDLWYYADFPYVLHNKTQLNQMEAAGWASHIFPISPGGVEAWTDSISAHASQISTFWENILSMRQAVADYLESTGGVRLWKKPRT
jgi:LmbE family N-acetylglucosaminyl deacetylase